MTNAELFKQTFGRYATDVWSLPENEFLEWLNADVQQKTGQWIAQDIHNCHTDFKCSECDYIHSFMHLYGEPTADYTYCPNCGAKMEVEYKWR